MRETIHLIMVNEQQFSQFTGESIDVGDDQLTSINKLSNLLILLALTYTHNCQMNSSEVCLSSGVFITHHPLPFLFTEFITICSPLFYKLWKASRQIESILQQSALVHLYTTYIPFLCPLIIITLFAQLASLFDSSVHSDWFNNSLKLMIRGR